MNERDIIKYMDSLSIDIDKCISKWSPVIKTLVSFEISKETIKKLCIFAEKCSYVENYFDTSKYIYTTANPFNGSQNFNIRGSQNFTNNQVAFPLSSSTKPEWLIPLVDAMKSFSNIIETYMTNNTRLSIKKEYFNILTMKKGIELENGIFIENDIIVKNDAYNDLMTNFEKCIDDRIKYITDIGYRNRQLRKDKLDKINECSKTY